LLNELPPLVGIIDFITRIAHFIFHKLKVKDNTIFLTIKGDFTCD